MGQRSIAQACEPRLCVAQNGRKMTFDFAFNSLNSIIQPVGAHRSFARSLARSLSIVRCVWQPYCLD